MTSTQMRADRGALSVADVLDRAADLITPEGAWTQEAYSRTKNKRTNGDLIAPKAPACWCVLGAISHVIGVDPSLTIWSDWDSRNPSLAGGAYDTVRSLLDAPVEEWNDEPSRIQPEVVAKLREAAALAREQSL